MVAWTPKNLKKVGEFLKCQGNPGKPGIVREFFKCQGSPGKPGIVRESLINETV